MASYFVKPPQRYKQIELTQTIVNRVSGTVNLLGFEASQKYFNLLYVFVDLKVRNVQ